MLSKVKAFARGEHSKVFGSFFRECATDLGRYVRRGSVHDDDFLCQVRGHHEEERKPGDWAEWFSPAPGSVRYAYIDPAKSGSFSRERPPQPEAST